MRSELNENLKEAIKSQEKQRVATLRLINAAIKDRDRLQANSLAGIDDAQMQCETRGGAGDVTDLVDCWLRCDKCGARRLVNKGCLKSLTTAAYQENWTTCLSGEGVAAGGERKEVPSGCGRRVLEDKVRLV